MPLCLANFSANARIDLAIRDPDGDVDHDGALYPGSVADETAPSAGSTLDDDWIAAPESRSLDDARSALSELVFLDGVRARLDVLTGGRVSE